MTDYDPATQQIEQIAREILVQFKDRDLGLIGIVHAAMGVIAMMARTADDPVADLDETLSMIRAAAVETIENTRPREAQDA